MSREIDVLVAREIMGFDVEPSSNYDGWYGDLIPIGNREFIDPEGWVYDKGRKAVPHFSTNLVCTWPLVEKLCNWDVDDNMLTLTGQGPDLEPRPDDEDSKGWWNAKISGTWGEVTAKADTAPMAICLAVLEMKDALRRENS